MRHAHLIQQKRLIRDYAIRMDGALQHNKDQSAATLCREQAITILRQILRAEPPRRGAPVSL